MIIKDVNHIRGIHMSHVYRRKEKTGRYTKITISHSISTTLSVFYYLSLLYIFISLICSKYNRFKKYTPSVQ